MLDALFAEIDTARQSLGDVDASLSGLAAELEALRTQPSAITAEAVAGLRARVEQAIQLSTAQATQAQLLHAADQRARNYLAESREAADALWQDASQKHGQLITDEDREAYALAEERERLALERDDIPAALRARSEQLTLTRDIYVRAGDAQGIARADELLQETNAQYRSALRARGFSEGEISAIDQLPSEAVSAETSESYRAEADLNALFDDPSFAASEITVAEMSPEDVSCPALPAAPCARGRE